MFCTCTQFGATLEQLFVYTYIHKTNAHPAKVIYLEIKRHVEKPIASNITFCIHEVISAILLVESFAAQCAKRYVVFKCLL